MAYIPTEDWGRVRAAVLTVERSQGRRGARGFDTYFDPKGYPYGAAWVLGIGFAGAVATVHNLMVRHGASFVRDTVASRTVTVTTDYDWIVARYAIAAGTFSLVRVGGASGGAAPVDPDDETINLPVCQVRYENSVARLFLYVANMPTPTLFAPLES